MATKRNSAARRKTRKAKKLFTKQAYEFLGKPAKGYHAGRRSRSRKTHKGNPVAKKSKTKMVKAPRGWIKAKAVRTIRRGGRTIVEVKR
jgi:hypothetical protein